ncbi:dNA primase [Clostridium sp. CAG:389]|jgi:DNA primase|nr:dNA primase [Clostridium sp. CAG:389]
MARYSEEILNEVRQANDIVDVISQYVHLKRSGRNYFGLCPFHNEKSPSFSVSPDKQIFHCFGCGVGGNVITFVSQIEGLNFVETVQMLAERANIQLPTLQNNGDTQREILKDKVYKVNEFTAEYYHQNLYKPQAKMAQEYVKKRQLTNETLKSFRIGFSGKFDELYQELKKQGFQEQEILESGLVNKNERGQYIDRYRNRLMFPICDARGRVIAFGGRVLDDSKPKYINSPENVVYSKGRHLFGLNVAKKGDTKKLLIVEGYMDVISLHQRGITNVVAPLGTALTEQQGWLLRKNSEQIILSFDSDDAGIKAKLRAIDILQKMGCDLRVIQLEGAKDPDEYIVKYGNMRFQNAVDKAFSVVEFKVKILKKELNLENTNDKIKFLNEIAKLISKVDNTIEREVYIEKIAKEYDISKEAIYAEVNKLTYKNDKSEKVLEKAKPVITHKKVETKEVSESIRRRENTIISILLTGDLSIFEIIKQNIKPEDFQDEINQEIAKKLYEEFEKGNSNINSIIDTLDQEHQNQITMIMAEDYEIEDLEKAIDDIIQAYKRDKLNNRKLEILELLEKTSNIEEKKELEKELSNIIITLARIK